MWVTRISWFSGNAAVFRGYAAGVFPFVLSLD
jgi:hypothetical protein